MDPNSQASFIPKKPLIASVAPVRSGGVSILWLGALFIFIMSLVGAGAAYFFASHVQDSIQQASDSLTRAQAAYDPNAVQNLIRLNNRLTQASTLLKNHLAPSALFTFLEQNTLTNVRFSDFSYSTNPSGEISLSLSGQAHDFASVALQSDVFSRSKSLKDVLFSDVNVDPSSGGVVFKVTAAVDPNLLLYGTVVTGGSAPSADAGAAQTASSTDASSTTP